MNNFNKELKEQADRNFDKTMALGRLSGALKIEERFLQANPQTAEEAYQVIAQVRAEFDQAQSESIQQTIDDAKSRLNGGSHE